MQVELSLDEALRRARPSLAKKIEYSVNLLRKAEKIALAYDRTDGYWLAFSGGKDSQALFHVAALAGVRFKAHMNLTSVDPPEVIRFVRRSYPEVRTIPPKDSIYHLAMYKAKMPPTRIARWCCAEYKEGAGAGKVTLIGIRHEESQRRAKRHEVEVSSRAFSGNLAEFDDFRKKRLGGVNITNATGERTVGCIRGKESLLISPIIDWTERDVWDFLDNVVRVPHCELYDKGKRRIGCLCCPMATRREKLQDIAEYPHVKRNWIKVMRYLIEHGYRCHDITDAEEMFDWWISGKSYEKWYADKYLQLHFDFKED